MRWEYAPPIMDVKVTRIIHGDECSFQVSKGLSITHTRRCYRDSGRATTIAHIVGCAVDFVELASALIAATPHRLRNDLKRVEWDVKPYYTIPFKDSL